MKKTFASIAFACVLAGASAAAQCAETVDPATAQVVKELLVQMKFREQIAVGLQRANANLPQALLKMHTDRINNNAKLTDDQKRAELAIVANDIPKMVMGVQRTVSDPKIIDDIEDEVVPMYARQFTLDELRELVAFYKTPAAVKLQKVLPQITQEANAASQAIFKARLTKVLEQTLRAK